MSSHILKSTDGQYTVVVGWDKPLLSFFAQVWKTEDYLKIESMESGDEPCESTDDPQSILVVGASDQEIISVESLAEKIAAYVEIPLPLADQLRREKDTNQTRSDLQDLMAELTRISLNA